MDCYPSRALHCCNSSSVVNKCSSQPTRSVSQGARSGLLSPSTVPLSSSSQPSSLALRVQAWTADQLKCEVGTCSSLSSGCAHTTRQFVDEGEDALSQTSHERTIFDSELELESEIDTLRQGDGIPEQSAADLVLPAFVGKCSPTFTWGTKEGREVLMELEEAYSEVVHWRLNVFNIPLGATGKKFVEESERLISAFAEGSRLESVVLLALMTMPHLLLQKPAPSTTHRQQVDCLQRRLQAWTDGNFDELLREGRALQNQRRFSRCTGHSLSPDDREVEATLAKGFARMISHGKVKAALRLLSRGSRGGVLDLDEIVATPSSSDSVRDILKQKHPVAQPASADALLKGAAAPTHDVIFECLDGPMIRSIALHSQGSAGPSGLDAANWKRMCTMYHGASKRLCSAVAALTKRIATAYVDPDLLRPFVACRLIPLAKNPGVRPIGVCELLRRIVGKAILRVIGDDIQCVAGCDQLCARQKSGCEAAVHAMHELFQSDDVEAVLLVDATNAFNTLNRAVMLHNIQTLCPSLAKSVVNVYRSAAELFVGGETIMSTEGTTQGDPLSTVIYALATLPLIKSVQKDGLSQIWFADDAGAGSKLTTLHCWWSALQEWGPKYGYHVNPPKTWLVTKDHHLEAAQKLFGPSGVKITTDGRPLLGAPLGSSSYASSFINKQVSEWKEEVRTLAGFATTQPHAAHAAYTHGLSSKWNYLARACDSTEIHLQKLEGVIRNDLLKGLTGRPVNDVERELLGLPARLGGMGVIKNGP